MPGVLHWVIFDCAQQTHASLISRIARLKGFTKLDSAYASVFQHTHGRWRLGFTHGRWRLGFALEARSSARRRLCANGSLTTTISNLNIEHFSRDGSFVGRTSLSMSHRYVFMVFKAKYQQRRPTISSKAHDTHTQFVGLTAYHSESSFSEAISSSAVSKLACYRSAIGDVIAQTRI